MTAARRLAAILAADVVGYSRLMSEVKACIAVGLRKAGLLSSDGFLCVGLISASFHAGRRSTSTSTAALATAVCAVIEKNAKFLVADHGLRRASLMSVSGARIVNRASRGRRSIDREFQVSRGD